MSEGHEEAFAGGRGSSDYRMASAWRRDSSGTPFVCFIGKLNYQDQEPSERGHSRMNIATIERQTTVTSVTEI